MYHETRKNSESLTGIERSDFFFVEQLITFHKVKCDWFIRAGITETTSHLGLQMLFSATQVPG